MTYWPRNRRRHPLDRQRGYVPTPAAIVMQDRSTGTLYLLSHDSDADDVVLTTPVPAQVFTTPHDPVIQTAFGAVRLFVEDGTLDFEVFTKPVTGAPVFTLNTTERRTTYELYGSGMASADDDLCLRKYTGVGRTVVIEDLGCVLTIGIEGILDTAGVGISDTADNSISDTVA